MNESPVDLILLCGFLGAGKTTLVQGLLQTAEFRRTALIVNEIGAIGLDHDLLRSAGSDEPVLLSGGCICCALGADLGHTLRDLYSRRQRGRVPGFDRVLIETTGLADPRPIVRDLVGDPWLAAHFRLLTVTAVIGVIEGLEVLDANWEAVAQVVCADRLIVSKCDLDDNGRAQDLMARLVRLNPSAKLAHTRAGAVSPELSRSLSSPYRANDCVRPIDERAEIGGHDVTSASVEVRHPMPWQTWARALDIAGAAGGGDLLRMKGILRITGLDSPVLVQSVGTTFYRPVRLHQWPSEDRTSRTVIIARGGAAEPLRRIVLECLAAGGSATARTPRTPNEERRDRMLAG